MGTLFLVVNLYLYKWLTLKAKRCFLFFRVCNEYNLKLIKLVFGKSLITKWPNILLSLHDWQPDTFEKQQDVLNLPTLSTT
jgi:hypothetical protein